MIADAAKIPADHMRRLHALAGPAPIVDLAHEVHYDDNNGGSISNNTAGTDGCGRRCGGNGGGIYNSSNGKVTLNGGTITGNTAAGTDTIEGRGGGIYNFGTVSGKFNGVTVPADDGQKGVVLDATSGNSPDDIYFP